MESLCGRVHFNTNDSRTLDCAITEERRYIRVNYDVSLPTLAEFMTSNWDLGIPDVMITMISGVHQSKAWKKPEHGTKLQKGIVKLTNTSQTWIFTHGLNYGLAKLIGDAVREDQDRRSVRGNWDLMSLSAFNQRIIHPRLIGVVPDALLNNSDQYRHGPGRVEIHAAETERATTKYEMNSNHNVFVLVNNTSYTTTAVFRGELERALQKEVSMRKDNARAAATHSMRMEDDGQEQSSTVMEYYDPVTYSIPLICILIQGGPAEIDQVLYYLNDNIPVMVIKGTGLMADLLAFAYEEIMERGGIDIEMNHLKPEIENKMTRYFPGYFKENESERKAYMEKILKCVEVSHKYDRKYITIFDLALTDSDLADLDWFILKALFACQPQYAINQRKAIRKNLLLTVMWNRPDLARSEIFQRDFSIANLRIDPDIFEQALLLRDREEFVDLFLEQNFAVSSFVTASQLKLLFTRAEDREFFITVVWEGILEKSPATPMRDKFVYIKMNAIIEYLTGIKNFVKVNDLAQGSQGQLIIDYPTAERQAINALIVWSVLMNRSELVKVLWKFCEQPIPMALFISSLYSNLSHYCPTSEMEKKAIENGKLFGTMAVDVLHLSYQDTTNRAFEILAEPFIDFEHMTPMEISYRVGNKHFIAHPCSQRYLNEVFNGGIRVVKSQSAFSIPDFIKIILSALLVFPMYLWIAFPRLEAKARDAKEKRRRLTIFTLSRHNHLVSTIACPVPVPMDEVRVGGDVVDFVSRASGFTDYSHISTVHMPSWTRAMEGSETPLQYNPRDSTREEPDWSDSRGLRYIFWKLFGNPRKRLSGTINSDVSVTQKMFCIWNAPVTKFWMYQVNYWCYLLLLSYVTFMHGCGNQTLDWTLWIWTTVNLLEYMCRTYFEYARRRLISLRVRLSEMFLIGNFLLFFMFSRLVDVGLPIDRYSTRILLCTALLFFYYRMVFLFFPISRKLGPMLEKIKLMVSVDFMVFLKMVMPFMVASAIAMQAALFPDLPFGWDSFRVTFYRAFFALFLTPSTDLQLESFGKCAHYRVTNDSSLPDTCWAGTHSVPDCPVVGVSSYMIVIQYAIILKMILVTLLAAMFYNTYSGVDREADSIWKFQRYQMVLDFSTRSAWPAPFSLLSYFVLLTMLSCGFVNHTVQRALKRKTSDLPPIIVRKADFFKYWKTMVKEYCRNVDMEVKEKKMAKDHFKKTLGIEEELNRHRSNWYRLRERIIALEQNVQEIRNMVSKPSENEPVTAPPSTMRFSRRDLFRRQL
ncbi:transient receptor potential cation channel subfamily M member 3-like [Paramacrobiotus metropolitanus]|uniref:transient receptor potential cation channel subfamily M member 3-like n=1 Tax=Paramacrobiotus metropolitanus TaxID=2943436 RepID=UPI002445FD12|nr:transient receptor potential cation channel subfamily M member 3-like [Paramacrobiotus metropolitanus]